MTTEQLLKIENLLVDHVPKLDKISWRPDMSQGHVPVPEPDEFSGKLLVWMRGSKFECCSILRASWTLITEGIVKYYDQT
jgi:hypothetical protein